MSGCGQRPESPKNLIEMQKSMLSKNEQPKTDENLN